MIFVRRTDGRTDWNCRYRRSSSSFVNDFLSSSWHFSLIRLFDSPISLPSVPLVLHVSMYLHYFSFTVTHHPTRLIPRSFSFWSRTLLFSSLSTYECLQLFPVLFISLLRLPTLSTDLRPLAFSISPVLHIAAAINEAFQSSPCVQVAFGSLRPSSVGIYW